MFSVAGAANSEGRWGMRGTTDERHGATRESDDVGGRGRPSGRWVWAAVAVAVAALGLWGWNAADRIVPSALGASLLTLAPDLGLVAGVGLALWLVLRFVVGRFITVPAAFVAVLVAALVV